MTESNNCPQCGRPLPPDTPQGLCPACLLQRGLETNTIGETTGGPAARWTPPRVEEIAASFPDLDILELIGRGGMGAVYKARQKELDRLVALKILPPEIGRDAGFAQRFAREAQAMAKLNHPNIVTIHDFGRRDAKSAEGILPASGEGVSPSLYFFLMEYVDGLSLRQVLNAGGVEAKEALAIVPQICDALQFAHDRGVVHRDIKPENILLNRAGQVKIADFGLAKLVGSSAGSSPVEPLSSSKEGKKIDDDIHATQHVMGTPQYMAPEQIQRPGDVDHRADIYSLGVVFYQMLTGELPKGKFEPPSRKVLIDVRLDEVVLRALEKEPTRRYQQASEVKTQVETIVATRPEEETPRQPKGTAEIDVDLVFGKLRRGLRYHKRIPIVGVRDGRRTIHWPGLLMWLIFTGLIVAIMEIAGAAWPATLTIGLSMTAILVLGILRCWAVPLDQLTQLESPPPQTPVPLTPEEKQKLDAARKIVRAPAIGLLVAAGISLAVLFAMIAVVTVFHRIPGIDMEPWVLALLILCLSPNIFVFFAAIGMLNLKGRICAVTAAVLTLLLSPGNILGLPMGIWALVVLSRRNIVEAFAAVNAPKSAKWRTWLKKTIVSLVIGIVVALLVRQFVLEAFIAQNDAVAPEIPIGSRVYVFKLARSFEPGDIIVYRHDGKNILGRVVEHGPMYHESLNRRVFAATLKIERRGEMPQDIDMTSVVGKVVFNTRSTGRPVTPKIQPADPSEQPQWRVTLPGGAAVELLGVSEHPSKGKPWWRPDGSPLTDRPYEYSMGSCAAQPGYRTNEIALVVRNLPEGQADSTWKLEPESNWSAWSGLTFSTGEKTIGTLQTGIALRTPDTTDHLTVKFGLAAGPWDDLTGSNGKNTHSYGGRVNVTFSPASEKDGATIVSASHNAKNQAVRIIAITQAGKEIPGRQNNGYAGDVQQLTANFNSVRLADIKEFRFQTRPYEWAEFKNVSLRPANGKPTKPPQPYPATQPGGKTLSFRIAPQSSSLAQDESKSCMDWLKAGRVGFWWKNSNIAGRIPQHAWMPMRDNIEGHDRLITGEYEGKKYLLVSDKPDEILAAPTAGQPAWGLSNVYKDSDPFNQPAVGFQFDQNGGDRFFTLTSSHLKQTLAIILNGEVVSVPIVQSAIRDKGVITGKFTEQEVADLVRALKAGMPATTQPADWFGPVVERTINQTGENFLIDLDSGKFITWPKEGFKGGNESFLRWIREQGIDAVGNTQKISPGLAGYDLVAMPMPNSMWDRPSHKLLLQATSFATSGNPVFLVAKELPTTFIIKTREGSVGFLQIIGFQENPKGVKIRYKLLKAAPSGASPATQNVGRLRGEK